MSTRRAQRQLKSLNELVAAWQLANGDEVRTMNERVDAARASLMAAEGSARATAMHLARIETAVLQKGKLSGTP